MTLSFMETKDFYRLRFSRGEITKLGLIDFSEKKRKYKSTNGRKLEVKLFYKIDIQLKLIRYISFLKTLHNI